MVSTACEGTSGFTLGPEVPSLFALLALPVVHPSWAKVVRHRLRLRAFRLRSLLPPTDTAPEIASVHIYNCIDCGLSGKRVGRWERRIMQRSAGEPSVAEEAVYRCCFLLSASEELALASRLPYQNATLDNCRLELQLVTCTRRG